ncbi:hypothetical protein AAY473_022938 [Plecturocebus cupreus]
MHTLGLALSPRLEYNGMITAYDNLDPLGSKTGSLYVAQAGLELLASSDDPNLDCQNAGIVEMGFCHIAQAGLELMGSSSPPTSASQSAGITGWSAVFTVHCNLPGSSNPSTLAGIAGATGALLLSPG